MRRLLARVWMFQHTAARRRLSLRLFQRYLRDWFQHTAARRRLTYRPDLVVLDDIVSTHSRPKAADIVAQTVTYAHIGFQHTAARRRLI